MVHRKPIKVKRTPIRLNENQKKQLKLWELMEITRTDDIIEIARHYDILRMGITNKSGFTSLPTFDPEESKNWHHFEAVYEICRVQGWDPKLYIESQFEFYHRFGKKFKFPMINMLYSVKAMKFFIQYQGEVHLKYKKDVGGEKRKRGKETVEIQEQIIRGITWSVKQIKGHYMYGNEVLTGEVKALYIFNNWQNLSPFYLYSVRWFHEVLEGITAKQADKYKKEFKRINSSISMRTVIDETVRKLEEENGIPRNLIFQ